MYAAPASNEQDPTLVSGYLIWPGQWADWQWNNQSASYLPELQDAPVRVTGVSIRFDYWCSQYSSGVMLYAPFFLALCVMDLSDVNDVGNPVDFYPTIQPNLFLRDYGRISERHIGTGADMAGVALGRPARILHRDFRVLACGEQNLAATPSTIVTVGDAGQRSISYRTKPFTLKPRQALMWTGGIYNTAQAGGIVCAFQVSGHFGYHRAGRE